MANPAIFKVVFVDLIAAADVKVSSGGSEKQSGFQWMKVHRDKRMNEWIISPSTVWGKKSYR